MTDSDRGRVTKTVRETATRRHRETDKVREGEEKRQTQTDRERERQKVCERVSVTRCGAVCAQPNH